MKKSNLTKPKIEHCKNLDEVRYHIDRLDSEIMPLLCERLHYISQAAQFKETIDDVRIYGRIEAIIQRAIAYANVYETDNDYIESVYRNIIDESIRHEKKKWQEINNKS